VLITIAGLTWGARSFPLGAEFVGISFIEQLRLALCDSLMGVSKSRAGGRIYWTKVSIDTLVLVVR
jgi:hypothetical protein